MTSKTFVTGTVIDSAWLNDVNTITYNTKTGTGSIVYSTTPTLVTPILGVATATTINKVTFTTPTTGSTLTISDGKTLACSNTLTLTGTDSSTVNFGTGGTSEYTGNKDATGGYVGLTLYKINFKNAANTFTSLLTNTNTAVRTYTFQDRDGTIVDNTDLALKANSISPTLTTPNIGVATATTVNKVTITAPATSSILTVADGSSLITSGAFATTLTATAATNATLPAGTNNIGYLEIPQNSKSAAYTTVLSDSGKHIYHPGADTTARIWTIDSNANVAYPIGTALTFINDTSGGVITIAITTDTMVLAGTGSTGSRTLAANGVATAIKVTSTRWIINGTGLT